MSPTSSRVMAAVSCSTASWEKMSSSVGSDMRVRRRSMESFATTRPLCRMTTREQTRRCYVEPWTSSPPASPTNTLRNPGSRTPPLYSRPNRHYRQRQLLHFQPRFYGCNEYDKCPAPWHRGRFEHLHPRTPAAACAAGPLSRRAMSAVRRTMASCFCIPHCPAAAPLPITRVTPERTKSATGCHYWYPSPENFSPAKCFG